MSIVFDTPGELDMRAFTTFGLSAKPNSTNPIGKFGTGLKNAVSTILRKGGTVRVKVSSTEYEFYVSNMEFRGMPFHQIKMKKRKKLSKNIPMVIRWDYAKLPFTTEYGKFWEMWQAFRELESNTRDENGETWFNPNPDMTIFDLNVKDRTLIEVISEDFEEAWRDRNSIFLPEALTVREGDEKVQIFNEPSKYLYWRGIRVKTLELPSVYTYNILVDMELTEDRTLKYDWRAMEVLAGYVARSKDQKMISTIVGADAQKHFEGKFDFDYTFVTPTEEFNQVVAKKKLRGNYVAPRAYSFYEKYSPPAVSVENETLKEKIQRLSRDTSLPTEVTDLMKHLLKCEIIEPSENPLQYDGIPF